MNEWASTEFFHFQAPCPVSVVRPFVSDDQHGNSLPELFAVNGAVMLLFDIVFLLLQYFTVENLLKYLLELNIHLQFNIFGALKCFFYVSVYEFCVLRNLKLNWTVANEQNWHHLILWETNWSLSEINKFKLKDLSEVTSWNARNTTRAIWGKVQKVLSFLKTKYQIMWCSMFSACTEHGELFTSLFHWVVILGFYQDVTVTEGFKC